MASRICAELTWETKELDYFRKDIKGYIEEEVERLEKKTNGTWKRIRMAKEEKGRNLE